LILGLRSDSESANFREKSRWLAGAEARTRHAAADHETGLLRPSAAEADGSPEWMLYESGRGDRRHGGAGAQKWSKRSKVAKQILSGRCSLGEIRIASGYPLNSATEPHSGQLQICSGLSDSCSMNSAIVRLIGPQFWQRR
jgi:hypothetical protein